MDKIKQWMAANPIAGMVAVAFVTALLTSFILGGRGPAGPAGPAGVQGPPGAVGDLSPPAGRLSAR